MTFPDMVRGSTAKHKRAKRKKKKKKKREEVVVDRWGAGPLGGGKAKTFGGGCVRKKNKPTRGSGLEIKETRRGGKSDKVYEKRRLRNRGCGNNSLSRGFVESLGRDHVSVEIYQEVHPKKAAGRVCTVFGSFYGQYAPE